MSSVCYHETISLKQRQQRGRLDKEYNKVSQVRKTRTEGALEYCPAEHPFC